MKTNLLRPALSYVAGLALGLVPAALFAAPLTETTAVHTKPDATAGVITVLKAGTEAKTAAGSVASTPAGWMAVEIEGPFTAYVDNKDLTKSLDVKPGAAIRLEPKADAAVLVVAEKGDKTTITGLRGKWTQISLEKNLVGYIHLGGTAGYLPPIATTPAGAAPAAPSSAGYATPANVPVAAGSAEGTAGLVRPFEGWFVSTRRPLVPRRPYDWALVDENGKRYAYLDVTKVAATELFDKYVDRPTIVQGIFKTTNEGKDLVIVVESMRLK